MRTLGVLGGMGPAATVDFMSKLVALVPAQRDQEHVPVVVYSVPQIPDRTQSLLANGPSPLPHMLNGIKVLEQSGASVICIPCNTAHAWYAQLKEQAHADVLHIVDAVVQDVCSALQRRDVLLKPSEPINVGLLATDGTLVCGLYQQRAPQSFCWLVPEAAEQASIMDGIHAVKSGDLLRGRAKLWAAADALRAHGAQAIVMGCTEIPLVLQPDDFELPLIDSTLALARHAVRAVKAEDSAPQMT